MVIRRKNSQDTGHKALYAESGASSWVTVISVFICICGGLIDGLTFILCYTIVIGAEQGIHSSPFMLITSSVDYTPFKDFWLRARRRKMSVGKALTQGSGRRHIKVSPAMRRDVGQCSPPRRIQKAIASHAPI